MQYSDVAIIYNPISTGDAPGNARRLHRQLRAAFPKVHVELLPTEDAGHADTLAYGFAGKHKNPLIISASGDGGYNEVINGALRAQEEGAKPICAVLPSGNANDHARSVQQQPLLQLIKKGRIIELEVLQLEARSTGGSQSRYAHSYIGIGLTPKVAVELNRHKLNTFKEAWILVKTLWSLQPVRISLNGKNMEIDSLTCSIVSGMAKVLTISPTAHLQDGLFEVATLRHRAKPVLILRLLKAAITHLGVSRRTDRFMFTLLEPSPVQLDGEIMHLPKNTKIQVTVIPGLLRTLA